MKDENQRGKISRKSLDEFLNSPATRALREAWREEEERLTAALNAIEGLEFQITCSACPFQLEGSIDGVPLYFRERWSEWQIGIGTTPAKIAFGSAQGFRMEGSFGHHDSYPEIISNCIEAWRASRD